LLAQHPEYKNAYFELVGYEIAATANVYDLRLAQFKNILYATQGRSATNAMGLAADAGLANDQALSARYDTMVAGKWVMWQSQPKIGYGDQDRYGTMHLGRSPS